MNLAGEQYITEAATIYHYEGQDENLNPSSNYFMFAGNFGMGNVETTSGNQGNQLLTGALTNNPYGEQQSRRHDGYGDRVRAKIR